MHSINHSDCFQNLTQEEHFFQHENAAEVEKMFLHYHGYLLGSLASLAILFSTAFIAAQLRVIRLREGSRKYHALLLNRAIGDLIGASTAVISAILAIFVPTSITAIAAFIGCFFYSTFWTAFVSYTCLSLVKLYAVWKPFLYRRAFTFKKCLYIIGVSWIIFVCCGSLCVGAMSHLHVGWVAEWHGFRYLFSTFFCFDYAFTIVTFLVTAAILKKASKVALLKSKNDGRSTQQRSRFPLWKLALNVSTFAVFQSPHVVWNLYLLTKKDCLFRIHSSETIGTQAFVGAAVLLRIIMDFLLSLITDSQFRHFFLDCFGVSRECFCFRITSQLSTTRNISTDSASQKRRKSTQQSTIA
ncbi:unnamed protein product, partial [Mesorhabditis belari]|uniref:G-protein coupled receptors family 1 profile domain-containing protein n=1 Tax=Mesorhabditis belari TaxID=2138241 RepID=A0AAF3F599_9BILA